jgi:enoyl-CoA hydratase/carnithine racemase
MPGHIGTSIVSNTRLMVNGSERLTQGDLLQARQRMKAMGVAVETMSDEEIQQRAQDRARAFRDEAPTTAAQAAKIILDGVKADRWRILVGDDAHEIDRRVRHSPEQAYTPEFFESFIKHVGWKVG